MNDRWSSRAGPTVRDAPQPHDKWRWKTSDPSQPVLFQMGEGLHSSPLHKKGSREKMSWAWVCTQSNWGAKQSKMLRVTQLISSRPGTLMLVFRVLNFVGFATAHSFSITGVRETSKTQSAVFQALIAITIFQHWVILPLLYRVWAFSPLVLTWKVALFPFYG